MINEKKWFWLLESWSGYLVFVHFVYFKSFYSFFLFFLVACIEMKTVKQMKNMRTWNGKSLDLLWLQLITCMSRNADKGRAFHKERLFLMGIFQLALVLLFSIMARYVFFSYHSETLTSPIINVSLLCLVVLTSQISLIVATFSWLEQD